MITGASFWGAPVFAGAWPQKRGEGLTVTTWLRDRAEQSFDDRGERIGDGWFRKDEIAVYAEFGATDRLTLISRLAWQDVARRRGASLDAASGMAASELGARYALRRGERHILSAQALFLIPGAGENVSNQPLGDGGEAAEARLLWGRSLSATVFVEAQGGFRWRADPFLDEARLDLTAGWRPRGGPWSMSAQSFSVASVQASRPGAPRFHQHRLQLSLGRRFDNGVEWHAGGYLTPAGRAVIDQRALFVQVWRRF